MALRHHQVKICMLNSLRAGWGHVIPSPLPFTEPQGQWVFNICLLDNYVIIMMVINEFFLIPCQAFSASVSDLD
jgi:hypothetical protein